MMAHTIVYFYTTFDEPKRVQYYVMASVVDVIDDALEINQALSAFLALQGVSVKEWAVDRWDASYMKLDDYEIREKGEDLIKKFSE